MMEPDRMLPLEWVIHAFREEPNCLLNEGHSDEVRLEEARRIAPIIEQHLRYAMKTPQAFHDACLMWLVNEQPMENSCTQTEYLFGDNVARSCFGEDFLATNGTEGRHELFELHTYVWLWYIMRRAIHNTISDCCERFDEEVGRLTLVSRSFHAAFGASARMVHEERTQGRLEGHLTHLLDAPIDMHWMMGGNASLTLSELRERIALQLGLTMWTVNTSGMPLRSYLHSRSSTAALYFLELWLRTNLRILR
jgi:hypothetical protein